MAPKRSGPNRAYYVVTGPGSRDNAKAPKALKARYITKSTSDIMSTFKTSLANSAPVQITGDDIVIYMLKDLESYPILEVTNGVQNIPENEEEIAEIADVITEWTDVFDVKLPSEFIHIIVWIPDITSETRDKLRKKDGVMYDEIIIKVIKFGQWTKDDVEANNAIFASTPSLDDLADKLRQPRAYKKRTVVTVDEETRQIVSVLKAQFTGESADAFPDYFVLKTDATERIVRSPTEFLNFANIKYVCDGFEFDNKDPGRHSEEKASPFTTFFIQTPVRDLRRLNREYAFGKGTSWKFSMYLEFDAPEKGGSPAIEIRKYTPMSDFRVDGLHGLPQLIGEVVSDPNHSDLWRMILQAICIACAGALLSLEKVFIVFALYIDENYIATRYLVCKNRVDQKVAILSKEFDLKDTTAARRLLLEIYNFIDYIDDSGDDRGVIDRLIALNKVVTDLKSLHSKSESDKQEGTSKRSSRAKAGTKLDKIAEES